MYKSKRYKQKIARDDLSPKAYELVNELKEIRMVCVMLHKKIEDTVAECAVGGRED